MSQQIVRNKFSPRIAVIAPNDLDSRTQQHFVDEVDINNLVNKYNRTGVIDHVRKTQARYGDFTELANYAENLDKVAQAKQGFEQLPSEIRNQFNNDMTAFYNYVMDPANVEQNVKWGILDKSALPKQPDSALAEPEPSVDSKQSPTESKK